MILSQVGAVLVLVEYSAKQQWFEKQKNVWEDACMKEQNKTIDLALHSLLHLSLTGTCKSWQIHPEYPLYHQCSRERKLTKYLQTTNSQCITLTGHGGMNAPHKTACVEVATYDQGGKVHQLVSAGPVMKLNIELETTRWLNPAI